MKMQKEDLRDFRTFYTTEAVYDSDLVRRYDLMTDGSVCRTGQLIKIEDRFRLAEKLLFSAIIWLSIVSMVARFINIDVIPNAVIWTSLICLSLVFMIRLICQHLTESLNYSSESCHNNLQYLASELDLTVNNIMCMVPKDICDMMREKLLTKARETLWLEEYADRYQGTPNYAHLIARAQAQRLRLCSIWELGNRFQVSPFTAWDKLMEEARASINRYAPESGLRIVV